MSSRRSLMNWWARCGWTWYMTDSFGLGVGGPRMRREPGHRGPGRFGGHERVRVARLLSRCANVQARQATTVARPPLRSPPRGFPAAQMDGAVRRPSSANFVASIFNIFGALPSLLVSGTSHDPAPVPLDTNGFRGDGISGTVQPRPSF